METCVLLFDLGMMEKTRRRGDSRGLDLDSRKAPTCDNSQGFFQQNSGVSVPKLEVSGLRTGCPNLVPKSPSLYPEYPGFFNPWCCTTLFGPNGPCIH